MRIFALVAFVALQLSMFTCETDIHIHSLDAGTSHFAQHGNESDGPENMLIDHSSQIHASHVFIEHEPNILDAIPSVSEPSYELATLDFTNVPHLIERPPKHLHG